jgi:hypothetical protein
MERPFDLHASKGIIAELAFGYCCLREMANDDKHR